MSFRQDRTNPSTAVSKWKGRSETPKGWPSTRVSTWLNGGLHGAALTYRFLGFGDSNGPASGIAQQELVGAGMDADGNHYFLMDANSNVAFVSFDKDFVSRGSIRYGAFGGSFHFGYGYVDTDTQACWMFGRQSASNSRWMTVKVPMSDFTGTSAWTFNSNSATTPNSWSGGSDSNTRYCRGGVVKTIGSTVAVVMSGSWAPYSSYQPGMMLLDWEEIDNAADDYSWEISIRGNNGNLNNSEAKLPMIDSQNRVWTGYRNTSGAAIQQNTSALSSAQDTGSFQTSGNDRSQAQTNTSGAGTFQILQDAVNQSGSKPTYYTLVHGQMTGQFSLMISKVADNGYSAPSGITNNVIDMRTGSNSVSEPTKSTPGVVDSEGNLYVMWSVYDGNPGPASPMHVMKIKGTDMSIEWHNAYFFTRTTDSTSTGGYIDNKCWHVALTPDETKLVCYGNWGPTGAASSWQPYAMELPLDGSGTTSLSSSSGKVLAEGPDWNPTYDWYLHYCPQTEIASASQFTSITTSASPAWNSYGANMTTTTNGGSYNQAISWNTTTTSTTGTGLTAQELDWS
mgnify:CR=1 FL=1